MWYIVVFLSINHAFLSITIFFTIRSIFFVKWKWSHWNNECSNKIILLTVTNTYFNQFSRNLHSLNKYWYTMPYTHYTAGVIRKWASFSWECFHAKEVLSRFYMSDWFPFMIKSQSWKISITRYMLKSISSTYNFQHLSEEFHIKWRKLKKWG